MKNTKRIYISIPMKGHDMDIQRKKAKKIEEKYIKRGCDVINPFDLGDKLKESFLKIGNAEPTYDDYLQEDLNNIPICTHMYMARGWMMSNGCLKEHSLSLTLKLKIIYE